MTLKHAFRPLSAAAVAALLLAAPGAAGAQSNVCAKREHIIAQLERAHGETRQSLGLQRDNGVIETYANVETGSWTIIVSLPTGVSCLVAVGEAYQADATKVSHLQDDGA